MPRHPKGTHARVLLTSVFGPYAQDDAFGSRAINPMELYHNQVTRAQGAFSLRMFHRSWGIMLLQANIPNPSTVLDFPTREAFARELREHRYDVVGITSIIVNVGKVREMCRMVRELSPGTQILVGGHVTAIPGIERMIDADHVVKGEGVAWLRSYFGVDPTAPVEHPDIVSGFGLRVAGLRIPKDKNAESATIIPSVGCPMGCNFCTTSAFFGGKGKIFNFLSSGEDVFAAMCQAERDLGVRSFFVMDENFLLQKRRAMELLALMEREGKSWQLYVFSSANALRKYTMEELVRLGVSWVWMGLESAQSSYSKLNGTDTLELVRDLQSHGIRVLGSTIIGLEHHTPGNIAGEIEHAVEHATDFHQFMLYTPVPGTPLHAEHRAAGTLLDVDLADIHGQFQFNFRHPAISAEQSKHFLDQAFVRDAERNGPSLFRICRTTLAGWRRYHQHPDPRVRERFTREAVLLRTGMSGLLWAMEHFLRSANPEVSMQIGALRREVAREFGLMSRVFAWTLGPVLWWSARREERRLQRGVTYEPPTFVERKNWDAREPEFVPATPEKEAALPVLAS